MDQAILLAQAARSRAIDHFSIAAVARMHLELFQQVIHRKSP
jgi:hypothetical protein